MGYSEAVCQLCGVSFSIARIRTIHEPLDAGWATYGGDGFVEADSMCEGTSGCQSVKRDGQNEAEHVAGPGCSSGSGYSGHRISVEEMSGCRALQCLLKKDEDWEEEEDDQDFEREGMYFLTGLGDGSPDEAPAEDLKPVRHGVDEVWVYNCIDEPFDDTMGLPFHPTCFEIYKIVSKQRLGAVSTHGLWSWRDLEGSYEAFFERFPRPIEVRNGGDQWWHHEPGNEFLVANPIEIPGLPVLLGSDLRKTSMVDGKETPFDLTLGVFTWTYKGDDDPYEKYHHTPPPTKQKPDLFSKLPAELLSTIIEPLSSKDIANLRLATPAFRQLPISLFRGLLLHEMPWLWEALDLPVGNTDWFSLYKHVKFSWQNLRGLQNRKRIWKDVNEIVTRIERYMREGKIKDEVTGDDMDDGDEE